ncbi:MAG TPA: metallophosphoesterase [Candidatus Lokiarchaeia archaeon]|nr:metallophosphoesterase [Candidatus Lokiarchaeia archaeon]
MPVIIVVACICVISFGLNSCLATSDPTPASQSYEANYPANPIVPIQNLSQGVISTGGRQIFYFVQVSDIHLNEMADPEGISNFTLFCDQVKSTIVPAFVVSTGDNVDGQTAGTDHFRTQDPEEYAIFNSTLQSYGFNSSFWFTLLGNHDRYDTEENLSLFLTFIRNETQYAVDFNPGFGIYRMIMLDDTFRYGLKTPFDLFGEMQADKLTNFEGLLANSDPQGINATVVFQHHPTSEILAETSANGSSYADLLAASHAQFVLNGHIHYPNLYANRGDFTEAECPSFKDRYMYRIAAFDGVLMSFSDVVLNQYPQIVITSPTDARFYNPNMNLSSMITRDEIHALLFDTAPMTSVYATIDGSVIGNLTDQGNHLWTVPYSPQVYATGIHHLVIYASSASGQAVQQLDFELTGFSPTPIAFSWLGLVYTMPYFTIFVVVIVILTGISLGLIFIPIIVASRKRRSPAGQTPESLDSNLLSRPQVVALLGMFAYIFLGPLIVGPFSSWHLGIVFATRVTIADGYVLDLETLIFTIVFLACGFCIERFAMDRWRNTHHRGRFPLFMNYLILIVTMGLMSWDLGWIVVVLSPVTYLFALLPVFFLRYKK